MEQVKQKTDRFVPAGGRVEAPAGQQIGTKAHRTTTRNWENELQIRKNTRCRYSHQQKSQKTSSTLSDCMIGE